MTASRTVVVLQGDLGRDLAIKPRSGAAVIGGALDGNCRCDDPHLGGVVIGAPIGGAVGATVGFLMIR